MINRLLNRLSLTRIILILLVSILPQSIWAEDGNYGLTIAGIPVTSGNANDILGNDYQGTATYNADNYILTLNNVNLQSLDGIVWSEEHNLTIQFSGNNIINCRTGSELNEDNGYCIYSASSSNTLTLTATNNESTLTLTPPNGGGSNSRKAIGGFSSFSLSDGWGMYSTDNYAQVTGMSGLQEGIGTVVLKGQPMGLKIAGVYVTSENKDNITGNNITTTEGGSISFEPAVISQEAGGTNTPATLTLNKATINGQIESTIQDLHVRLIGSNTITPSSTYDAPIVFSSEGMVLDVANLTLESSEEDNGEINLKGDITKSGSNNNIGLKSDIYRFSYVINGEQETEFQDISLWTNDIKYWIIDTDDNGNNRIFYNPHYGITVSSYPVTSINKDMVTYLSGGDITYSSNDNTIHVPANSSLDNITIKSHRNNLNVSINGECTLKAIGFEQSSEFAATSGTLTFKQGESGTDQLTLNNNTAAIYGFSDVLFEGSMQLISPTNKSDLASATSVTIANYTESYNIIVENKTITDGNAGNVLGNGTVSYDKTNNTLTLNNARLTKRIFFGNESLIIDLEGASSITTEQDAAIATEEGSLTIKSSNKKGSLSLTSSGGNGIIQGMETVNITKPLVSSANLTDPQTTSATIHPVSAPIMENRLKEDSGLRVLLYNPDDNGGAGEIKYTVTYADQSTGATTQTYSSGGLLMTKPGTLTAWVELDSENKSSNLVGKYFGYKQNPTKVVFNGTDPVTFTPELEPAIESTDKISVSFTSGDLSINDNIATISAFGSYMITGQLSSEDPYDYTNTMILNPDTIKVNVQAVPATPTIVKEDRTYLSTEKITITSSSPSGTTICYKWDEGNEQDYTAPIAIEGTALHAWVKYQATGGSVYIYSDPAEATFNVIPDISELDFSPSSINNITYTGRAITPSVAITKNGETVSSDNYTVKTVQEVEGEQTVVEAINVGSYTLVIEGKNEYGGKKEMPFTISQADMASIAIEEIATQTYTGEDLTPTLSVKLGEVTVSSDEYTISYTKDGATATEIKEAGTYTVTLTSTDKNFSTTNTKSTTFTIKAASASISAEKQTATYTGSDIEYDKSKITVEPASLSSSITTTYYATNPDDSQANTPSPMGSAPKNIGQYWVKIGLSNANYQASKTVTLTILPPKPTITPEGGQQRYDTTITLAKPYDVQGADIYYSWNNGADSTLYSSPISVETGTLSVWMIVEFTGVDVAGEKYKSEVATATFTKQDNPALSFIGQNNETIEAAEYTIGGTDQLLPTLQNPHNVTVSLESSNSQVATINDGVVTPVGVGSTTITASSPATEGYIAGNTSYTLTVYKSLSHESISITVANSTYNGEPQTPTVTVKDGETTLTKAETSDDTGDFTVAYSNNTLAAASTDNLAPTATITGKGYYKGEVNRTFTINKAASTITKAPTANTLTFNGEQQELITAGECSGGTMQYKLSTDETWSTNVPKASAQGTYTVMYQVAGDQNHTSIEASDDTRIEVTIAASNITNATVTLSKTSFTYNGTEQKPTVASVTIPAAEGDTGSTPITLTGNDYEVSSYSEGCTDKGSYTVTVTLKGNYSGTATANFEITARSLEDATIGEITAMTYTGEEMKPTPTVSVILTEGAAEATVLRSGTDFTYGYTNNTNVPAEDAANENLPTVTITGTGNYTGSASATFTINKAAATITKTPTANTLTFNGEQQELITAGECSGGTMQYKLSSEETWSENVPKASAQGTYIVLYQVAGDQNHTSIEASDDTRIEVTIAASNITNATVTLSKTSFTYNGTEQKPTVTSVSIPATEGDTGSNPITLSESDYEVSSYSEGCTDIGTYTVTVTLKGNYSGTATANFNITARSLTDAIIGDITAITYTGNEIEPTPTVSVMLTEGATEATVLRVNTDFTYSYKNNTNVPAEGATNENLPTVTITGKGNYTGSTSTTFTINKAAATISKTPTANTLTFNGEQQELITAGECSGGTMQYKLSTEENWSTNVPKAKDTGKYTVEYKITGDQNHLDSEAESIVVTINDRTIDPTENIEFSDGQSYASFYSADEDLALPEEGIAVFMITGLDGNTLTTQAVTYIPKGVPVLVMKASGTTQAIDPSEVSNNMLHYATSDVTADGTTYILYNGEYVRATGTIPAGKCYLKLNKPSGARALAIGNGTTGIDRLDNTEWATDNWFDLNGRRIEKPTKKGFYIKNGKKVVVK